MDPASIQKIAFVTPGGLFEFLLLCFGLNNAIASFMEIALDDVKGKCYFVYMDDIVVYSHTWKT